MKEELVSFEVAKLANEKGFDWPCSWCYSSEEDDITSEELGEIKIVLQSAIDYNSDDVFCEEDVKAAIDNGYSNTCLAPTQSLLQKWLREEHNVMIELIYIGQSKERLRSGEVWMCRSDGLIMIVEETYEQALEAGLKKALEKLQQ